MGEKFCENCGSQLNEGAKFCSSCGSVVSTNTSETTTNLGEEKKVCTNCGSCFSAVGCSFLKVCAAHFSR